MPRGKSRVIRVDMIDRHKKIPYSLVLLMIRRIGGLEEDLKREKGFKTPQTLFLSA